MGFTLKEKNLLPYQRKEFAHSAISYFLEYFTPNELGGKNENKRVAPRENLLIHLK